MDKQKIHLIRALVSGFFILSLDQVAKYAAVRAPDYTFYIILPYLGWELLLNPGVAFGLPIPNWFIVLVTPFILGALTIFWAKKYRAPKTKFTTYYGLSFILFGALSNYIDRFLTTATIDYLRVLYSVINTADISIVMGVLLVLLTDVHKKT